MRWVGVWAMLLAAPALAAPRLSVELEPRVTAVVDANQEILLVVIPDQGDAWTRLAKRITGRASRWEVLAELNGAGPNLLADQKILIPLSYARPELQREALRKLFPKDRFTSRGWSHVVTLSEGVEGESLWKIAEWFTGDGANYTRIRTANNLQRLSTRKGDTILIPAELLTSSLRTAPAAPRDAEDDPGDESPSTILTSSAVAASSSAAAAIPVTPAKLDYVRDGERPHALYRLQKGEALYSSVAIRFTGRVFSNDVNEAVDAIVKFNGIEDVARLPVGYAVKIPMEMLTPEYRPPDDPRRVAEERASRESSRAARRVEARNLSGVHVILDAGHGGRDVGTLHENTWESTYVYDVMCRVKRILETKTKAKVSSTTRSVSSGFRIPEKNILEQLTDHVVLTSPKYDLADPAVGVNLRWYLANSLFRKSLKQSVAPEKVVFISIHADSLHSSLRGAMAYVPAERLVQGSYSKKGKIYLARSEVRESPVVTHSEDDALRAEGFSKAAAESIIAAFQKRRLDVHPFSSVRTSVVRDGKEWVPAVIRYNKVPTRLLLEICNLGNEDDRRLLKTAAHRQKIAEAIVEGLGDYFSQPPPAGPAAVKTAAR